jgi:hypothetical protein
MKRILGVILSWSFFLSPFIALLVLYLTGYFSR